MTKINQLFGLVHNSDKNDIIKNKLNELSVIYLYGNLVGWRARERIKHSWQITYDDQIMLTHEQQKASLLKQFITVSIYCMPSHQHCSLISLPEICIQNADHLKWIKSNKNVCSSVYMVKQAEVSTHHRNSRHIAS